MSIKVRANKQMRFLRVEMDKEFTQEALGRISVTLYAAKVLTDFGRTDTAFDDSLLSVVLHEAGNIKKYLATLLRMQARYTVRLYIKTQDSAALKTKLEEFALAVKQIQTEQAITVEPGRDWDGYGVCLQWVYERVALTNTDKYVAGDATVVLATDRDVFFCKDRVVHVTAGELGMLRRSIARRRKKKVYEYRT